MNTCMDYWNVVLYTTDAFTFCRSDAIYSALYDGTSMIEIIRGHEYLSHPFAVSLFMGVRFIGQIGGPTRCQKPISGQGRMSV